MNRSILVVCLLSLALVVSAQKRANSVDRGLLKHQWNSNFVNGPWSRIGKRARVENDMWSSSSSSITSDTELLCGLTTQDLETLGWSDMNEYYEQCVRDKRWFLDLLAIDAFKGISHQREPREFELQEKKTLVEQDPVSSKSSRLVDLISNNLSNLDRD